MKLFRSSSCAKKKRGGFSLVESSLSLGVLSLGFLSLTPLLEIGMKTSRGAGDDRTGAQIAETLVQEARQGTLTAGTTYFDLNGAPCSSTQAAYSAQAMAAPLAGSLSQVTLQVTPLGAPGRSRTYAVVVQAP
jgi:uncharacterized protein (TIGR02598 family)